MKKTFVIRDASVIDRVAAFLAENWQGMAALGKPLAVSVGEHRAKRSLEQNALMWVWLGFIAEHAVVNGQRFSPEAWNVHMKREHLPAMCRKGLAKWVELPRGERELAMSTTDLDVEEMGLYLNALEAYAADVLGLTLPPTPYPE